MRGTPRLPDPPAALPLRSLIKRDGAGRLTWRMVSGSAVDLRQSRPQLPLIAFRYCPVAAAAALAGPDRDTARAVAMHDPVSSLASRGSPLKGQLYCPNPRRCQNPGACARRKSAGEAMPAKVRAGLDSLLAAVELEAPQCWKSCWTAAFDMSDKNKAERAERLAAALRSNLRRRKQQARQRTAPEPEPDEEQPTDEEKADDES